jgi:diacylglycerol O-acyltransferase/trehalose O-mycolyltransferase
MLGRVRLVRILVVAAVVLAGCAATDTGTDAGTDRAAGGSQRDGSARVVDTAARSDRVRDLTIASPAVGRTVHVRLLLPAAYGSQPHRRWPVLYLLHGCCDTYESWTRSTDVEEPTARSGVLVVMPEGGRVGFYSDWLDGPRWERFHLTELPRILAHDFRASDVRAIGGLSMGGLGTLAYAARHRGMFRAAASFSGVVHTRLSPQESEGYRGLVRSEGEDPDKLWGDPVADAKVWAAHNPYDLAPKLRGTALYLSVGNGQPGPLDPPGTEPDSLEAALAAENAALADRLHADGIPVQLSFSGPGTHSWPYWERELHRAWPMLASALGAG